MKLKILLMPIMIIVLVLAIWVVYPAYTNGVDGLKEKRAELRVEKTVLSDLLEKKKNIQKMSSDLTSRRDDKIILYDFLVPSRKDEGIIDSLNFFAFNSGLNVFGIAVSKSQMNSPIIAFNDHPLEGQPLALPQIQNITVESQFTGDYGKIREFIRSIEKLNRYNNFSNIEIAKSDVAPGQSNSDLLSLNLTNNFNFLEKTVFSPGHLNNPVFARSVLDFQIIKDIKEQKSSSVPVLNVEQKSRSNPFSL